MFFGDTKLTKNQVNFCPSLLKEVKSKKQKTMALCTANWIILFWLSYTFFLFDLFLVARVEILAKT